MAKTFVVSDESINSYGFRVLTAGIDLSRFLKNPIGKFNHSDQWEDPSYSGPICKWSNLQKLKEGLHADAEFDTEDPKGKLIANKVENGFLNAASIGFRVIETSEDPELMLPGQRYATVTKCILVEISIVDIPSNENACCLYDDNDKRIELKDGSDLMNLSAFKKTVHPVENMKKLSIKAGLTALLAFFGLEPGKDHEVELSDDQLQKLNDDVAQVTSLKAAKEKADKDLSDANLAHTSALKLKDDKIAELQAKVDALPGAGQTTPPAGKNPEGGAPEKSLSIKAENVQTEINNDY